jgi:hypothetical protein
MLDTVLRTRQIKWDYKADEVVLVMQNQFTGNTFFFVPCSDVLSSHECAATRWLRTLCLVLALGVGIVIADHAKAE